SDFENGKIYRITPGGVVLNSYDHGALDNGAPGFAPLGERVWAVKTFQGRLYYSIWDVFGQPNKVYSIALDGAGDFITSSVQLEISYLPTGFTMTPISDIAFSPRCCMLLAERSMWCDTESYAHQS